jgi:hypothetical protein
MLRRSLFDPPLQPRVGCEGLPGSRARDNEWLRRLGCFFKDLNRFVAPLMNRPFGIRPGMVSGAICVEADFFC